VAEVVVAYGASASQSNVVRLRPIAQDATDAQLMSKLCWAQQKLKEDDEYFKNVLREAGLAVPASQAPPPYLAARNSRSPRSPPPSTRAEEYSNRPLARYYKWTSEQNLAVAEVVVAYGASASQSNVVRLRPIAQDATDAQLTSKLGWAQQKLREDDEYFKKMLGAAGRAVPASQAPPLYGRPSPTSSSCGRPSARAPRASA